MTQPILKLREEVSGLLAQQAESFNRSIDGIREEIVRQVPRVATQVDEKIVEELRAELESQIKFMKEDTLKKLHEEKANF